MKAGAARIVALLPLIAYVVWCGWGYCALKELSKDSPWRAARTLKMGHQLVASDIALAKDAKFERASHPRSALLKRYLNRDVAKDAPLSSEDVVTLPILRPTGGSDVYYFASLQAYLELQPHLDVGSKLTLCWDQNACISDRQIVAVMCGDKEVCTAIMVLPADKLGLVGTRDSMRLFLSGGKE